MRKQEYIVNRTDWPTVIIYLLLVLIGWVTIYAAGYQPDDPKSIFDLGTTAGKQFMFIVTSFVLIVAIMVIDFRFYSSNAVYIGYFATLALLLLVLVVGRKISGATSWFHFGSFGLQPSEFAKFATALAVAKYIHHYNVKFDKLKPLLLLAMMIGGPILLILAQPDAGTALVFSGFVIVLYREGLTPVILILGLALIALFLIVLLVPPLYIYIGIGVIVVAYILFNLKSVKRILISIGAGLVTAALVFGLGFAITEVLQPHQQTRLKVLFNPDIDPLGAGWNVTQSKTAIGSGGFSGKGYLNGLVTKNEFVPEDETDFIFCTLSEEQGWLGSMLVILLYCALILRVIVLAERQKARIARVYGYSVAAVMFMHFSMNIGMTIGLFPVVGIPLPMLSYGGSSLWAFSILLFILVKFDAHRMQLLKR